MFRANNSIVAVLFATAVVMSCGESKKKPVYMGVDVLEDVVDTMSVARSGDVIPVPYRVEGGVKYVAVKVNGMGVDMIFDTGCSGTLISMAEANYLVQKGKLTEEDVIGTSQAMIADGSVVNNTVINLKEVIIADKILCTNVEATVSDNINAPLLLGNEVLDRVASITIDTENEVLNFMLK